MPEIYGPVITYCTNIHPGESWDEIFSNLQTHLLTVKRAVCPHDPFPIGLRLSCRAATELTAEKSARLLEWCREHGCYIPTLNGFPYGVFHGEPVKENVYLPDWRHAERVEYTQILSSLLDQWLPANVRGSISTVPIGFRKFIHEDDERLVRKNVLRTLEHLDLLAQKSGKTIILALEPEPGCMLETTDDVATFMEKMHFPSHLGCYIGICFDCCHQAMAYEDAAASLSLLAASGIAIGKVQASSALRLQGADFDILERFNESCYLHQVAVRRPNGQMIRYNDLPEALSARQNDRAGEEWRIHFHVPVFVEHMQSYETTQFFLKDTLRRLKRDMLVEVETYTWDVLPRELQTETVTESIIREIEWVKTQIDEANRCP